MTQTTWVQLWHKPMPTRVYDGIDYSHSRLQGFFIRYRFFLNRFFFCFRDAMDTNLSKKKKRKKFKNLIVGERQCFVIRIFFLLPHPISYVAFLLPFAALLPPFAAFFVAAVSPPPFCRNCLHIKPQMKSKKNFFFFKLNS